MSDIRNDKTYETPADADMSEDPEARRLGAALRASKIGVFEFEPQSNRAFWDDRVRALWGIPEGEDITYETVIGQVHPDDVDLHNRNTEIALNPNGSGQLDMEYRVYPRDGRPMRWIRAKATCTFNGDIPIRLLGTVQDVTERREYEDRNQLLMNELRHRVKNTLATIKSIVRLSQNDNKTMEEYVEALESRLLSLAETHNILSHNDWGVVKLDTILDKEFNAFFPSEAKAYRLEGESVTISADHVQIVTMALHELLTNAIKYGALTLPDGLIAIKATQYEDITHIVWEERNGPPLKANTQPSGGFGSFLLTQVVKGELQADISYDLRPNGLVFSMKFPSKAL